MPLDSDYSFETSEDMIPTTYYGDVLEALTIQNEMLSEQNNNLRIYLEKFEDTVKCQADTYILLENSYKELETVTEQLTAQNVKLTEMNQYTAYVFAIVLAFVLYRILGGALNAIFGG